MSRSRVYVGRLYLPCRTGLTYLLWPHRMTDRVYPSSHNASPEYSSYGFNFERVVMPPTLQLPRMREGIDVAQLAIELMLLRGHRQDALSRVQECWNVARKASRNPSQLGMQIEPVGSFLLLLLLFLLRYCSGSGDAGSLDSFTIRVVWVNGNNTLGRNVKQVMHRSES